jgi:hypothetical protein
VSFNHGRVDDGEELIGFQAGTADQNAVYTRLTEESGCIMRFDTATVLKRHLLSTALATAWTELLTNQRENIARLLKVPISVVAPEKSIVPCACAAFAKVKAIRVGAIIRAT